MMGALALVIPSARIFHSLTALLLKEYQGMSSGRTLLLRNFSVNTVNAYAYLSTCTICAVPLAVAVRRLAAHCVVLRLKRRNMPRDAGVHEPLSSIRQIFGVSSRSGRALHFAFILFTCSTSKTIHVKCVCAPACLSVCLSFFCLPVT